MKNNKYPRGGYAPGHYSCKCINCKQEFEGDKRAVQCELCAIEMDNIKADNGTVKQETLEESANKYYPIQTTDLICSPKLVRDAFIAGATSKYVQKQRIEAIIWTLEELRNIDTVKYIDPKINELEQQLKELQDESNTNKST